MLGQDGMGMLGLFKTGPMIDPVRADHGFLDATDLGPLRASGETVIGLWGHSNHRCWLKVVTRLLLC